MEPISLQWGPTDAQGYAVTYSEASRRESCARAMHRYSPSDKILNESRSLPPPRTGSICSKRLDEGILLGGGNRRGIIRTRTVLHREETMNFDEFTGEVQHRLELPGAGEAVRAIRATLMTLGQRIPR